MDHRWDNVVQGPPSDAFRTHERHGALPIAEDEDVRRRDSEIAAENALRGGTGAPRGVRQLSAWEIGLAFHDQRDLYTRDSRVDASGYGRGPSYHPTDGSYAYHREPSTHVHAPTTDANKQEREAWPWLNYHDREDDPFLFRRYEPGLWARMKSRVSSVLHIGSPAESVRRADLRIKQDVDDVLAFRADVDASDIQVTVAVGEVTLDGTVPDETTRRRAEETAQGIRGVRAVHNRLTVRKDEPMDANVAFVVPLALLGGA